MPNSFFQDAQIMAPALDAIYSAAPASGDIGLGSHLLQLATAQPGLGSPAQPVANLTSGGPIGTAPATVDSAAAFLVNQTTAGQTLSLPTPSNPAIVRTAHMVNVGSTAFTVGGVSVAPGVSHAQLWHGTAWVPVS
jgi:hypothetical protein